MVGVQHVRGRDALEQLLLYFQRRLAGGQTCAVAQAKDVRVHRHGGLAKGHIEHHVGGFAAHAGQGLQRLARAGHFAAVLLDQDAAGFQQVLGLALVQADGLDVLAQAFQPQVEDLLRGVGHRVELARGLVDAHIGGLGGQQHGGQQLERRAVFQLGFRVRVGGLEGGKEMADVGGLHQARHVTS